MISKTPNILQKLLVGLIVILASVSLMAIILGFTGKKFYNSAPSSGASSMIGVEADLGLSAPTQEQSENSFRGQEVADSATPISSAPAPNTNNSPTDQKIIKRGALEVTVQKIDETANQIKALAQQNNGYVEGLTISGEPNEFKTASMVIRVSKENFDEVLSKIKDLAVRVTTEQEFQDDTTDRILDLETQIKNLEQVEAQYQQILKTATKVEDILQITERLNSTRLQIEYLKAQTQKLNDRVDLASIHISMKEEIDVSILGIEWRPLYELKQAVRAGLEGLIVVINSLLGLVAAVPAIAVFASAILVIMWASAELFLRLNIIGYIKKIIKRLEK